MIKIDSKTFVLFIFYYTSFIKESWEKIVSPFPQKNLAAQLFSTLIIIIKNAANQHIRMIPEGSCDTEDWSNDTEK